MITLGETTIYHLGDTALFSDLRLIGERHSPDVALVPIGGHFTMDHEDAAYACSLIGAPTVIPCHYNTFPPIGRTRGLQAQVESETSSKVVVLEPGETYEPERRCRASGTPAVDRPCDSQVAGRLGIARRDGVRPGALEVAPIVTQGVRASTPLTANAAGAAWRTVAGAAAQTCGPRFSQRVRSRQSWAIRAIAGGREHRAGEAVVEALVDDPDAPLERVVADQAAGVET